MRPIKFRCWFAERMWYGIPKITFSEDGVRQVDLNHDHDDFCADADTWTGHGDYVLMQFTGLHDRNGTEIYEGDCLGVFQPTDGEFGDEIWVVSFCGGCFVAREEVSRAVTDLNVLIFEDIEIVGNQYENPELVDREAV